MSVSLGSTGPVRAYSLSSQSPRAYSELNTGANIILTDDTNRIIKMNSDCNQIILSANTLQPYVPQEGGWMPDTKYTSLIVPTSRVRVSTVAEGDNERCDMQFRPSSEESMRKKLAKGFIDVVVSAREYTPLEFTDIMTRYKEQRAPVLAVHARAKETLKQQIAEAQEALRHTLNNNPLPDISNLL